MLLGVLIGVLIATYAGAPLLPLLAVYALMQCGAAYALSRHPGCLRLAMPVLISGALLLQLHIPVFAEAVALAPWIANIAEWLLAISSCIALVLATYHGIFSEPGDGRRNTSASI